MLLLCSPNDFDHCIPEEWIRQSLSKTILATLIELCNGPARPSMLEHFTLHCRYSHEFDLNGCRYYVCVIVFKARPFKGMLM